jgi:hypothetical protein
MLSKIWNLSNFLILFISIITAIIGIIKKNKHKALSHLFIYPLASFIQDNLTLFDPITGLKIFETVNENVLGKSIHIFIIVEFTSIYFFFYKLSIFSNQIKKNIIYLFIAFFCIYFIMAITLENFSLYYEKIYFIQSCFILFPSYIYIYQLFTGPPKFKLANEPSFWFNAGIFIFFMLSLPFFFMLDHFKNGQFYYFRSIVYNFGYSIIFSFLIKAYFCKPKITI